MTFSLDLRVPVIFADADQAGDDDALFAEGFAYPADATFDPALPGVYPPGCVCCAPRNPAGRALGSLLQRRARGDVKFFRRVVACTLTEAGRREVEAALAHDPVASACYRLI